MLLKRQLPYFCNWKILCVAIFAVFVFASSNVLVRSTKKLHLVNIFHWYINCTYTHTWYLIHLCHLLQILCNFMNAYPPTPFKQYPCINARSEDCKNGYIITQVRVWDVYGIRCASLLVSFTCELIFGMGMFDWWCGWLPSLLTVWVPLAVCLSYDDNDFVINDNKTIQFLREHIQQKLSSRYNGRRGRTPTHTPTYSNTHMHTHIPGWYI